jgi:hypothetical protein
MTTPVESLRALKRTREFLREISVGKAMRIGVLRAKARDCLHHYPFDCHLDERWADDVCEHGYLRELCRKCKEVGE